MALEKGIASLVEAFIAAGRPSSRDQHIDDRRAGRNKCLNQRSTPFFQRHMKFLILF